MLAGGDGELDAFYRVIAPYYDDDYADIHGGRDVEFYRKLAQSCPGPVLEMGCGTGRILLPLARAGVVISGMDRSLAMLQRLTVPPCIANPPRCGTASPPFMATSAATMPAAGFG